jgi:chromosome segregation ATPase
MRCTYLKKKKKTQKIELQNHNGLLEKCLEKKKKKLERVASEMSEIKNRNSFLENQFTKFENEKSTLHIQVASLEDEKSDLHSRVAVLENKNSELQKRVTDLEKCDGEQQKQIAEHKKEKAEHQEQVAALNNEVSKYLNKEKQMEVARQKEKSEDHLFMNVRILFEDSFLAHQVLVRLSKVRSS